MQNLEKKGNKREPSWNLQEAVVLLAAYIEIQEGKCTKRDMIKQVSRNLRIMAQNSGIRIDEIYRNENGISYQLKSMESAVKGYKEGIPASRRFIEAVSLYRENKPQYQKILNASNKIINNEFAYIHTKRGISKRNESKNNIGKKTLYSPRLLAVSEKIIRKYFVNGIRKESSIAENKFRNIYKEETGKTLSEKIDFDELISRICIEYSNKYYAVSKTTKRFIKQLVVKAFNKGNHIIFYKELYQQNSEFMDKAAIYSSELLKHILKQCMPDLVYRRASLSESVNDDLKKDIIACYGKNIVMTFEEIKAILIYTDYYQIRSVCSRNAEFVWVREESYALTSKIRISEIDRSDTLKIIEQDIKLQGFSTFQRINISNSIELNQDVSEAAIREALFNIALSNDYERNRSIISVKNKIINAPDLMAKHCAQLQRATLDDLISYEIAMTDQSAYSLKKAYEIMIRINKDTFLSKEKIEFNITKTDAVLDIFIQNDIIPLIKINSFTSFPYIDGIPWNSFLLDSYCKHYSKKYCSMGGPSKKKPVGAIFPSYMRFSTYDELLSQVVANANIQLTNESVNDYLLKRAFILRKKDVKKIIAKAQEIRIQKGK